MRTQGTLTTWNEAQGHGLLSPEDGSADVYVHVSAMPHDGLRPRLGETLSWETDVGPDGKARATQIWRIGDRGAVAAAAKRRQDGARRKKAAVFWVVVAAAAAIAYALFFR